MSNMDKFYEEVSLETGWSIEDVKRGYALFLIEDGIRVIQRIDDLDQYGLSKFETDTEAGEQALKDGYDVYKASDDDEYLAGWYVLRN